MAADGTKLLSRGSEWRRVDPQMWANSLLLASRHGWKPDVSSIFLMADDFEVSDANAIGLAKAWDRFLADVPTYPHYRMKVGGADLGREEEVLVEVDRLTDLCEFCRAGAFTISPWGARYIYTVQGCTRRTAVLMKSAEWNGLPFIVALAGLVLLTTGCMTRYGVGVTSYLADDVPFPTASKDTKIAVVTGSDPEEPLLEKEVKRKIEYLVGQRGYGIGSVEEADYILSAFFAIDDGTTATGTRSVYHSGGTSHTRVYTSTGQWATATTRHPGYRTYEPYSYTYFTRYLGVNLYERERWVRSKDEDLADAIAWRATTISSGSSSDLRCVIDYLLVPTFERFGEDTGERKRTTVREGDKRVKQLRESYRQGPAH